MATPSNDFSYMYQVQLQNDGSFVLKDFDNSTTDGITPIPVGTGISVSDNIPDPTFNGGSDNPAASRRCHQRSLHFDRRGRIISIHIGRNVFLRFAGSHV